MSVTKPTGPAVVLPRVRTPAVSRAGTWTCGDTHLYPCTPDQVARDVIATHLRYAAQMLAMMHARTQAR